VLMRAPVHPYTRSLLAAVPFPDLDRPLDFATLQKGISKDTSAWPEAFHDSADRHASIDLGDGHFVLARPDARAADLRP
jgi:peptide/nickel transport system ATP-binding protein